MSARSMRITAGITALIVVTLIVYVMSVDAFSTGLIENVVVEAGSEPPAASLFFDKEQSSAEFITEISSIPMDAPGSYNIQLLVREKEYSSMLTIKDTIAPEADTVDHEIWPEETLEATDFVTNISDVTDVTISFEQQLEYDKVGVQEASILLLDAGGNKSVVTALLTIKSDTESPVIEGVSDQTIFVGDKISYKNNVTVTDNRDGDVKLDIDNSDVNVKKVGTYKVAYTATDYAGNASTVTAAIEVVEKPPDYVDPDELNEQADQILAKIIKADMTDVAKAWAIHRWTRYNIGYTSTYEKLDWMKAAQHGLSRGSGDCYIYYATARLLLERVGFETQTVTRDGGRRSEHYWNLVHIEGGWYHFDTTPIIDEESCFLCTDAEVDRFSVEELKNYYKFDKSKHPATPTEPLAERTKYLK